MKQSIIIDQRILADLTVSEQASDWMVVFCHGYKGFKDWGAWNLVAEYFAKHGVDFLKFNFSLNGGTLSCPIDFPDLDAFGRNTYSQEVKDLNTVIDYVRKNYPSKKVALIGHSRGGGIVTLVAGQNAAVDKVITWAGVCDYKRRFPTGAELKKWEDEGVRYILNGRTKQEMPHYYSFYQDFIDHEEELDILKWAARIKIPQLVIHGKQDQAVNVSESEELLKANPNAEYFALDASHTFGSRHPWTERNLPFELETVVIQSIKFVK